MPDETTPGPSGPAQPLGAAWDGHATTFALAADQASRVELALYEEDGHTEWRRVDVERDAGGLWLARVAGARPGQKYGYRVHGPWDPDRGLRFNPAKLLLDPYARCISGELRLDPAIFGHQGTDDLVRDDRDSAPFVPRSVIVDPAFDWAGDSAPDVPWQRTIIYEAHVKGLTKRHPKVPEHLRGTYGGIASAPMLDHLVKLGITTVELLPVQHCLTEPRLLERGLPNYWGYNTIGFFAPDRRFALGGGDPVTEFKTMVKALHQAGLEVILDVVYNHTAEGDERGPTLCFRGLDNPAYYRLSPESRRHCKDFTGCGNTLNVMDPRALQLVLDSLRYWVTEMHVDGFRFDLASALGRDEQDFNPRGAFTEAIESDPVISRVKLIAEPWDVAEGGYQVGNFPPQWAEWNDKYRDTVRAFWRGDESLAGAVATRLAGSSDLYGGGGRHPLASVNFVTVHDGFTLRDLVSYDEKHNEANGETSGPDENRSWNCGVEGPTDDEEIIALRCRQKRNFLVTLLCSQGVPMLLAGDEMGRTQQGNNNAYCQDSEISWTDWNLGDIQQNLLRFTQHLVSLRHEYPALRRLEFLHGRKLHGAEIKDLSWFRPDGREMTDKDWGSFVHCFGMRLAGDLVDNLPDDDLPGHDATVLLLLNASVDDIDFVLPAHRKGLKWQPLVDTAAWDVPADALLRAGTEFRLEARSMAALSLIAGATAPAARE